MQINKSLVPLEQQQTSCKDHNLHKFLTIFTLKLLSIPFAGFEPKNLKTNDHYSLIISFHLTVQI
ncbi:hypothetical protein C0J52_08952 [Blattella germanica]|nr:hypothetical protein C0J52_08952 [Blattella germanica]